MARMVAPHLPADRVPMVIESFVIARTSRCLQPPGDPKAVTRLAQLWEQMSGTKTQGVNPLKYILGGGAGLLGGLIMGYALQTAYEAMPPTMVLTVIGAVLGAVVAHYLRGTKTFEDCMLKLVINERRSVVRKEMVTDECEFWVPKALMWHPKGNGGETARAPPTCGCTCPSASASLNRSATWSTAWGCRWTCTRRSTAP